MVNDSSNDVDLKDIAQLIFELGLKARELKSLIIQELESSGLTERQIMILEHLEKSNPLTISSISKYLPNMSASTLSEELTYLWKKKGMIEKVIDSEDQRSRIISITRAGRAICKDLLVIRQRIHDAIIASLELNSDESPIVMGILRRSILNMDKEILALRERQESS